ncbi:hypothetical protein D3C85_15560 [compost metagenome]
MDLQCALDLDQSVTVHPFGHLAEVLLPLNVAKGMSDKEIVSLFDGAFVPIYATWPIREFPKEKSWVPGGPLFGMVFDWCQLYKPFLIGKLEVKGVVKGKTSPKLHGVIHYTDGHLIDSSNMESIQVAFLSSSVGYQPDRQQRKLIGVHRIYIHQRPEVMTDHR